MKRKLIFYCIICALVYVTGCKNDSGVKESDGLYIKLHKSVFQKPLQDYIKSSSNKWLAYQVFQSCDNRAVSIVVKPTCSKYEIYSSPISRYSVYNNKLLIFYSGDRYLFKDEDTIKTNFDYITNFINDHPESFMNDRDSSGHFIFDSITRLINTSYPVQLVYAYDTDSMEINFPYKGLTSKLIKGLDEEKTKFEFNYNPE